MVDGVKPPASLQVIVLGSGGGPDEMNITSFLVRSIVLQWRPGSMIAVDAGVQFGAITNIFERTLQDANAELAEEWKTNNENPNPSSFVDSTRFAKGTTLNHGPFKGFTCPAQTPRANAAYVMRQLISTILLTHAHLDHVAALAINSPLYVPPIERLKVVAGLPTTINAIKAHIFNDLIWPNLSNECNGTGFFEYLRLRDGGSEARGEMSDAAYTTVAEGISIFPRSVSHGLCAEGLRVCDSVRNSIHRHGSEIEDISTGFGSGLAALLSSMLNWILRIISYPFAGSNVKRPTKKTYDSTAYFIKDNASGTEVLIFGDIEPDSMSYTPRNIFVWRDAAPKIRSGALKAIFLECSWDSSQQGELYGHMNPFYIMEELQILAEYVCPDWVRSDGRSKSSSDGNRSQLLSDISNGQKGSSLASKNDGEPDLGPLHNITVVIIHTKERVDDGLGIGELIRRDLVTLEQKYGLGCNFVISEPGMSMEF